VKVQVAPNLSTSPSELAQNLLDARQRELEVLSGLTDEQMYGSKMRIIEPPIWEMGHVGWFQERWILRNLYGEALLWSNADTLYDSFNIPNVERWDLAFPSHQETLSYITDILQRCMERLAERELTDEAAYFYRMVTNHEDMHGETMVHIRQTLGYLAPPITNTRPVSPFIDHDFEPHDVAIPGGTFLLGATRDMPFVLDNEKWAHPVELAPFYISATPVTTAQYQAFVEAGGYQAREYWSAEGWEWRRKAGLEQPIYWRREADGSWSRRVFDRYCPLDPFLPMVYVNFYEANAYCAWAGRRLPTEAEWEAAAAAEPAPDGRSFTQAKRQYPWGDEPPAPEHANLDSAALGLVDVRALPKGDSAFGCRQMLGNIWEWTADMFDAYPGFEIDPYETYSAPSFGQQKVLRGGCWVTRSRVIRNTWRNFYTPDRNNIFAGFRTCAT
jgi:iron(II)-dependent oxidoreductase